MKFINELYRRFVVWRYEKIGLLYGDWDSYGYMFGESDNPHESAFLRWERRYKALGYKPIPRDTWVGAGGYGERYKHLLEVKGDTHEHQ